jgi:photosystem II stability/assembly factor-like uncharacterized protein
MTPRQALCFLAVVAFHVGEMNAQSGWFWQNPLPQGNALSGVSFTDARTGTAVGDGGTIVRTTNGGASWTLQSSGFPYQLSGVSFTDANTGTAVGVAGTILRTTDGGASWTLQSSGTSSWLRGVSFTDANTGTAVGDGSTIVHTTDGGASWKLQSSGRAYGLFNGEMSHLFGVSFTDASTGTAVGDLGTILRTNTGGLTFVKELRSRDIAPQLALHQNYPNPFNPSTTIKYELPKASDIRLSVYDILGREVYVLVNERREAGSYEVKFEAAGLSSGVYIYRLQAEDFVQAKKFVVLK